MAESSGRGGQLAAWVTAYIGLGSNLGDRLAFLRQARFALTGQALRVTASSALYASEPVGGPVQDDYYNAVVAVTTRLSPLDLLAHCQSVEMLAGRERQQRWGARTLDLDLLLYADLELALPQLEVPHPRMHQRRFVLQPLCDLAPQLIYPRLGRALSELLVELPDTPWVRRLQSQW
ncbi:MAG: 2-amino-4-hydroxy-6-hydroxymethyldihydropteridine diphosphokinase [Desulfuromonadaceae bacterium]|nr:2-amino-4-hydroxy-6-hydroxymethyldihydropteridine diphosphokinase [Desulfuromonadaceae bacterium]